MKPSVPAIAALLLACLSPCAAAQTVPLCVGQDVAGGPHLPAGHGLAAGEIPDCTRIGNTTTFTLKVPTIIHWNEFGVGPGETLRYEFPGVANRVVLNRDLSGGRSLIDGNIFAQGRFILLKPFGAIQVRPGAVIDADEGVLLSTLEVSDEQALLDGQEVEFTGDGSTFIHNQGTLRASAGDVVLVSGSIDNRGGGQILAPSGAVRLGAGTRIRLAAAGEPRILVLDGDGGTITNSGLLEARDVVEASVTAANPVPAGQRDPIINNHGIIRAAGPGGRVFLRAGPGQILNGKNATIEAGQPLAIVGDLVTEGTIVDRNDGGNPTAASGSRQFPRLSSGGLSRTALSDFQLSRLSFNFVNGLESGRTKKTASSSGSRAHASNKVTVRGGGAAGDEERRKPTAKRIILRRGMFFGKKTSG